MSGNGMHTAPNPGPPIGKVHDISFDREKTLMRTITTEGQGEEAREGSIVTIHLEITQPAEDGQLYTVFKSKDKNPEGLRFELFRSYYSGANQAAHRKPVFSSCALCALLRPAPTLLQRPWSVRSFSASLAP